MRNVLFAAAALLALAGPTVAGPDIRIETDVPMSVAAKSYPDWNSIPDLSFTCEGVDDPSHHADITVSHQARSIRINGAEAGPMTKSAAMYNNVRNRFGNYVIVIEVSRVEGPTWMLAEGPNTWWFSDHGRLLYNCLP
jgi:hypothetical protein